MAIKILMLRHGEVKTHRGDVPITESGKSYARSVGRHIGKRFNIFTVLDGGTLRTKQTASEISIGIKESGGKISTEKTSFALRNPDLYVGGERVNMVSTPTSLAEQVDKLSVEQAGTVPFFKGFFSADDRIGYWLNGENVPGETSAIVSARIMHFAKSFIDLSDTEQAIVAVTHSPILRACTIHSLGFDIGEPAWVSGLIIDVADDREIQVSVIDDTLKI